ncbi:MAG: cytochrome c-type biogenesis protein [Gemmatimonadota bacterium]
MIATARRPRRGTGGQRVGGRGVAPLLLAVLLLAGGSAGSAGRLCAQQVEVVTTGNRTLDERTRDVASQLRCPVCQGNSIQDSPSELAQEMKGVVRDQLAAGRTPQEVKQYFIDKYGEWILLEPTASGFNLVVYLLPIVGVVGGGALIWRAVRKWTTPPETGAAAGPGPRS